MAASRGQPRAKESPIVNALAELGALKEIQHDHHLAIRKLEEWREDVQHQAEFMAQMTARARTRRAFRMRVLGYTCAALTVLIQLALAIHTFVGGG